MFNDDDNIQRILNVIKEQQTPVTKKKKEVVSESSIDPTLNSTLESFKEQAAKKDNIIEENRKFRDELKSYLVESWMNHVIENSLKTKKAIMSESTTRLGQSIVKSFVAEEGAHNLLNKMSTKSMILSDAAYRLNQIYTEAVDEELDKLDKDAAIDKVEDTKAQFFEDIDASDDYDEICSCINDRVSQATQDFIQKNMIDKMDIQDMMNTTKERIDNVRTGNPETDEEIKQEQTIRLKKNIRNKDNRPHSVYEQIIINLTHDVICNESAKAEYTNSNGKIDMDAIVEKAIMFYTVLETVNTLRLKDVNEDYIKESISI